MGRTSTIIHRNQYAAGGVPTLLALGCFREGRLQSIAVRQVGGTDQAFTVDVFDSLAAYTPGSSSGYDAADPGDDVAQPELHKVVPQLNATAGNVASYKDNVGAPYRNRDGGWTDALGKIYLVITPGGSGDMSWDVVIKGTTNPGV